MKARRLGDRLEVAAVRVACGLPAAVQRRLARRAAAHATGALAPDLALMLALRRLRNPEPFDALSVEAARARYRRETILHAGRPIAVGAVRALHVAGAAGALAARLYVPRAPRAPRGARPAPPPLLVFFHGGGFVVGDLDTHDPLCRALCRDAAVAVLSVAYRLAPEHPFPAAVEDARAAVAWAVRSAALLGADPDRVAVGGDSAGGMLAAVVSRLAAREGGPAPALQLLVYPAVDRLGAWQSMERFGEGHLLTSAEIGWFHRHYLAGATEVRRDDPRLVPLRAADHGGLPPAVVVTASHDPLRDEGEAYAAALAAAGTPVTLRRLDGLVHGFVHLVGVSRSAREAVAEIAVLLRAGLDRERAAEQRRHQIRSDATPASNAGRSRSK
jgi:acetyl esterase